MISDGYNVQGGFDDVGVAIRTRGHWNTIQKVFQCLQFPCLTSNSDSLSAFASGLTLRCLFLSSPSLWEFPS